MKASKESKKKSSEKGVSFDALDTIDRHSDSMDKLASLVSKLDMKLDKQETQYNDTSFFLFILKVLWLVKYSYMIKFRILNISG